MRRSLALAAVVLAGALAAPAAAYDVRSVGLGLTEPGTPSADNPYVSVPGPAKLGAGEHPDVVFDVQFPIDTTKSGARATGGGVKQIDAQLPRGLIVDPTATQRCTVAQISGAAPRCPAGSQVGRAILNLDNGFPQGFPLYNVDPPAGVPARLGFNLLGVAVYVDASVRSGSDYGISARVQDVSQALSLEGAQIELWGVPADAVHDVYRTAADGRENVPANVQARAFTSNPGRCTGSPLRFSASAIGWQDPVSSGAKSTTTQLGDGTPLTVAGCENVRFDPRVTVKPKTTAPDSPTGLDVTVEVPQTDNPGARSTSHLKDLSLLLPEGMNVNPSAADGLSSCSPAQIALSSDAAPTCPDAAALGDVEIVTPLLADPLRGKAYLASQGDNPFGTTLALYVAASGSGVVIKLPGRIDADPATGRLRVTFADNPELPFSLLRVSLDDGPRAVLTTPPTCGPKTVEATATPWSGTGAVALTDGFAIDCAAGLGTFAPGFSAGTVSPRAGQFSPLSISVTRPDGQAALQDLSVALPDGLLAKLAGVPLCADPASGACDPASRVGGATVTAGAGSKPFPLGGDVFLTGPYKGAPYGLVTRVRAIAGPLDLGTVVVRQALSIDPETTAVSAVSDPLPTILAGIPIRLRTLDFALDRDGFAVNPTSCAATSIAGTLGALGGAVAAVGSRFQVAGCADLPLTPKLALSLRGRGKTLRDGGHPGITARLTQPAGQSGLKRVEVKLPLSLALDPDNAQELCEADAAAGKAPSCPVKSAIGTATVRSPLLPEPLSGPVYFVKGVRTTASGRQVRTLPKLVLPLRGNGLQINVRANTAVRKGKLVTQFDGIPDAPISRFDLSLNGGSNGVLVATKSICKRTKKTGLRYRGHSDKLTTGTIRLRTSCR